MKHILFLFFIFSIKSFSQEKEIKNLTYLISPDENTYVDLETWTFNDDKTITIENIIKNTKVIVKYKIQKGFLTLNDNKDYGRIKFFKNHFKIYDANHNYISYTKLVKSNLKCNKLEFDEIIRKSCWKLFLKKSYETFCLDNKKNKIIKISNTYVLLIFDRWVYPIKELSNNQMNLCFSLSKNDLIVQRI